MALTRWLLGAMLLLTACAKDEVTRTEIVLRIDADDAVLARMRMGRLRVTVDSENKPGAAGVKVAEYPAAVLTWPVDIHVVPSGDNDRADQIGFIVDALDSAGTVQVQTRALTSFDPRKKRLLALRLHQCGSMSFGALCNADVACVGAACLTCSADGSCGATPFTPGAQLPPFTAETGPHDGMPSSLDGGSTASDAGPSISDAGSDAARPQTDAAASDAAPASTADASITDAAVDLSDAAVPSVDCNTAPLWTRFTNASHAIPPNVLPFSKVVVLDGGVADQYICRAIDPMGNVVPGKITGSADKFEAYCMYVNLGTPRVGTGSATFDIPVPVAGCTLGLARVEHVNNAALPGNAIPAGYDKAGNVFYSCGIQITDAGSPAIGEHFGTVSATSNDPCRVEYYGQPPPASTSFDVLVQTKD